jgi:hypothetical protein
MPLRLRLMVYGDGSGNRFGVRVHDAGDERWSKAVGVLDWTGWREVTVDAPQSWGHWGGDNVFDLPVRNVSVEITATADSGARGAVYVDDIALDYEQAGSVLVTNFERPLRSLRLWMLGAAGTSVVTGDGLGPDLRVSVPFTLARRRGREARFVTLLEPFADRPAVTAFRELPDGSIEVTGPDFTDVFQFDVTGKLKFDRRIR